METDIVIGTRSRPKLLTRTLDHLWKRTRSPYRLHLVDDGSDPKAQGLVAQMLIGRHVTSAMLRADSLGIAANFRAAVHLSTSDPLVLTDDDVLCPDVEPDWLARGLAVMARRPQLGLLALNNPGCVIPDSHHVREYDAEMDLRYCGYLGATFLFVRRRLLMEWAALVPDPGISPAKNLCLFAGFLGYRAGFLAHTYCQHIGAVSQRKGEPVKLVGVIDDQTLEPPEGYR